MRWRGTISETDYMYIPAVVEVASVFGLVRLDKTIVDIRLRPSPVRFCPWWVSAINICYSLLSHCCVAYPWPLCANTNSSTKPEVNSILQRCRGKIKPRTQVTCMKKLVKIRHVVPETADRQTDKQIYLQTDKQTRSSQYFASLWME